jgi:hypothetical protein
VTIDGAVARANTRTTTTAHRKPAPPAVWRGARSLRRHGPHAGPAGGAGRGRGTLTFLAVGLGLAPAHRIHHRQRIPASHRRARGRGVAGARSRLRSGSLEFLRHAACLCLRLLRPSRPLFTGADPKGPFVVGVGDGSRLWIRLSQHFDPATSNPQYWRLKIVWELSFLVRYSKKSSALEARLDGRGVARGVAHRRASRRRHWCCARPDSSLTGPQRPRDSRAPCFRRAARMPFLVRSAPPCRRANGPTRGGSELEVEGGAPVDGRQVWWACRRTAAFCVSRGQQFQRAAHASEATLPRRGTDAGACCSRSRSSSRRPRQCSWHPSASAAAATGAHTAAQQPGRGSVRRAAVVK